MLVIKSVRKVNTQNILESLCVQVQPTGSRKKEPAAALLSKPPGGQTPTRPTSRTTQPRPCALAASPYKTAAARSQQLVPTDREFASQ
jgi:hypothetical protein